MSVSSEVDWWYVVQITMLKNSCALAIKELKQWMMPEKVVAPNKSSIICGFLQIDFSGA